MSWKRRLLELSLAGGMLAATAGCGDNGPNVRVCNANPDPCRRPAPSPFLATGRPRGAALGPG